MNDASENGDQELRYETMKENIESTEPSYALDRKNLNA
jgi:hypothetical protein